MILIVTDSMSRQTENLRESDIELGKNGVVDIYRMIDGKFYIYAGGEWRCVEKG